MGGKSNVHKCSSSIGVYYLLDTLWLKELRLREVLIRSQAGTFICSNMFSCLLSPAHHSGSMKSLKIPSSRTC